MPIIIIEETLSSEDLLTTREIPVWLNNVSLSGAGVETSQAVDVGSKLLIEFADADQSLKLKAEVMNSRTVPDGGGFELGVQFCDLNAEDEELLKTYIS